jgi:hypothetical protein
MNVDDHVVHFGDRHQLVYEQKKGFALFNNLLSKPDIVFSETSFAHDQKEVILSIVNLTKIGITRKIRRSNTYKNIICSLQKT